MRITLIVGFIFAFSLSIFGQDSTGVKSSLLWEIKGKKVESPSYIMGTMHLIPKDKFLFPDHAKEKLKNSEVLVMEIGGITGEKSNVVKYMMLDTGKVFDYFSDAQLDTLFSYTEEELGYNEDQMRMMFGKMKPLVILQLFTKDSFGENPESYELTLEEIAKSDSLPIEGLETIEDQVAIFDKIPVEDQVEMLMATIRNQSAESSNEQDEMIEVFLSQDIDAIYEFTHSSSEDIGNMEQELLNNRNENWIPIIKKLIKKKRCFIAVGAAHLGGPNGVIQLLLEEGYELTPIKL